MAAIRILTRGGFNMSQRLRDYRLFWREFRGNFHTTGAVLPSGRLLAGSLARYVGQHAGPQRILKWGPAPGQSRRGSSAHCGPAIPLTWSSSTNSLSPICASDSPAIRPSWRSAGNRGVLHRPVEQLDQAEPYDVIVSGLPLNNFSVAQVDSILGTFRGPLCRGGILSFFEYIAIRMPVRWSAGGTSAFACAASGGR